MQKNETKQAKNKSNNKNLGRLSVKVGAIVRSPKEY